MTTSSEGYGNIVQNNDDDDVDVDMMMAPRDDTLRIDNDKSQPPIERNVKIIPISSGSSSSSNMKTNSFEDEILEIELNEEEIHLFDTLKKTAKAWEEGKIQVATSSSSSSMNTNTNIDNDSNKKTIQIRIAGGWVRDKILGLQTHDVDIALDACTGVEFAHAVKEYHAATVAEEAQQTGGTATNNNNNKNKIGKIGVIAANPSQSKHLETATMKIFSNDVDFSNLRHETYAEDSRIPDIVMGTPHEDAYRRDCTINTLYYNLSTERIEDFTHRGLKDLLQTKVVNTPLTPYKTFMDDPLRLLRVIRFAVRYKMELSEEIKNACKHLQIHNELRRKVSRERIGLELEGMISGKHSNPIQAMDLICRMDLADSVFFLPSSSSTDLIGTIGQARLKPVPYLSTGATVDGEVMMSRARASAWDETRQCLQVLSKVLYAFNVHRNNSGSSVEMIIKKSSTGTTAAVTPINARLVYLAVVLLPYRQLQYIEKQKTKSVVEYMIREGIKFKNKDVLCSVILVDNLDDMIRLLQQTVEVTPSMRLQVGLLLRSAKEMWVTTLIVATVVLLRKHDDASQELHWCTQAKKLYETIVVGMDLDECWKTKPLMDGKDLIRVLELDRGPEVGVYMQEQVKWILTNPNGTIEDLQCFLKSFKNTREFENNQAATHVSKKAK
jgi:tRNA nucleotidyltransferase (CCA-adding enzyme)